MILGKILITLCMTILASVLIIPFFVDDTQLIKKILIPQLVVLFGLVLFGIWA